MDSKLFNESNSKYTWLDLPEIYKTIINKEYKSCIETVKLYETFEDICIRVNNFLNKLKSDKIESDKPVLIVTHQTICNAILHYVNPVINDKNIVEMGEIIRIEI